MLTLAFPPPSSVICFLHGASSLSEYPLIPPPAVSAPTTTDLRPPPEPPPQFMEKFCIGSLNLLSDSFHRFSILSDALGYVVPSRPPRKPPWMCLGVLGGPISGHYCLGDPLEFRFYHLCFNKSGVSGGYYFFFLAALSLIKISVWYRVLWYCAATVKEVHMDISFLVFWCSNLNAGSLMSINTLSSPSFQQVDFTLTVWLDHRETTYSRTVHIPAKKMILNWIVSKTVDSPSIMAIYHGKLLTGWLVGLVIWFDVGRICPAVSLCIDTKYVYVLISRSSLCLGYALTLLNHPDCNVVSLLIK